MVDIKELIKNSELKFAHDVMIHAMIRAREMEGGLKKEIIPELIFLDSTTGKVVARITLSFDTLKSLSEVLVKNLEGYDKEFKNKEIPKQPKIETKSTSSYLG